MPYFLIFAQEFNYKHNELLSMQAFYVLISACELHDLLVHTQETTESRLLFHLNEVLA